MAFLRKLLGIIGPLNLIFHGRALPPTTDIMDFRIFGGEPVNITDFPYTVSLKSGEDKLCGGVILDRNVVLSAAHCIKVMKNDWLVIAGRTNYDEKSRRTEQVMTIASLHAHPGYQRHPLRNDIGIIILNEDFKWTTFVQPARLPLNSQRSFTEEEKLAVVGWGKVESGSLSETLLKVFIPVRNQSHCSKFFGQNFDPESMICAGGDGKDSCNGDSGGPLVNKLGELAGIVSYGQLICGRNGGVYASVNFYLDWIEEMIKTGRCTSSCDDKKKTNEEPKRIVCLYQSWAANRKAEAKISVNEVDPFLCTDLMYNFVGMGDDFKAQPLSLKAETAVGGAFDKLSSLKENNPLLRTWICVGGYDAGSIGFSKMAASASNRGIFIESVLTLLKKHKLDGVNIQWQYPGERGGSANDNENLVRLAQEIRQEFNKEGYLIAISLSIFHEHINNAFQVAELNKHLHYFNLLTFDYHGAWNRLTGINAPLNDQEDEDGWNVVQTAKDWIKGGVPPEKINLGVPLYGRTWKLRDTDENGVNAPASGPGDDGGYATYPEICQNIKINNWKTKIDSHSGGLYAFKNDQWTSYEDPSSVREKAELVVTLKLGGIMIAHVDADDLHGTCSSGIYPLIHSVRDVLLTKSKI